MHVQRFRVPDRPLRAVAARIRALPAQVESLIAECDEVALRARPGPTEWSAIEVIGHLVDMMQVWRERVEQIMLHEQPFLPGFDQGAYVRQRPYQSARLNAVLDDLRQSCDRFAGLVETLRPTALRRDALHEDMGPVTLEQCVREPIDSAADHLAQIQAALNAARHPND